jgi:hypothetical protein
MQAVEKEFDSNHELSCSRSAWRICDQIPHNGNAVDHNGIVAVGSVQGRQRCGRCSGVRIELPHRNAGIVQSVVRSIFASDWMDA